MVIIKRVGTKTVKQRTQCDPIKINYYCEEKDWLGPSFNSDEMFYFDYLHPQYLKMPPERMPGYRRYDLADT